MNHFTRAFTVLVMIFSFFLFESAAQSPRSKGVLSLREIDSLIEKKSYSDALEALSEYILNFPQDFDSAQKRIKICMEQRKKFNAAADELAEKLQNSSDENSLDEAALTEIDEQKMELIGFMESLDSSPSKESVDFTNDARRTVRLSYFINLSNSIMSQGFEILKSASLDSSEKYLQAVRKFLESLKLKNSASDVVFDGKTEIPAVYPDRMKNEVDEQIKSVGRFCISLENLIPLCQEKYENYTAALEAFDFSAAGKALDEVVPAFLRLAEARNFIYEAGKKLSALEIEAGLLYPPLKNASYITFSRRAVMTGTEFNGLGVLGVADLFLNSRIEAMKDEVYRTVRALFISMEQKITSDGTDIFISDYSALSKDRQNVREICAHGKKLHAVYENVSDSPLAGYKNYSAAVDFVGNLAKSDLRTLFSVVKNAGGRGGENSDFSKADSKKITQEKINSIAYLQKQLSSLENLSVSAPVFSEENLTLQKMSEADEKVFFLPQDEKVPLDEMILFFENTRDCTQNVLSSKIESIWIFLSENYARIADEVLSDISNQQNEVRAFLDGIADDSQGISIVKYYPSKALEKTSSIESQIETEIARLEEFERTLDGKNGTEENGGEFASNRATVGAAVLSLKSALSENSLAMRDAKLKANEALRAANDANVKFAQAENLCAKKQYDDARFALNQADERYKFSLSNDENPSLRDEFERKIAELDERITVRQNEWVVSSVRESITQAYNEYYAGNFSSAKKTLEDATSVWEKTQAKENQEISTLMFLVSSALETSGGKEISFSDPLYKDMGAYINSASLQYKKGFDAYNSGDRDEGIKLLTQARDEIRNVRRVFPKNTAANNLTLLINKILDPKLYSASVQERIRQASVVAGSGEEIDIKTAVNDLKELRELIPEEKTVSAAIEKMESDLDKLMKSERVKKEYAESLRLTRLAEKEKNSAEKIRLLDQALSLNRNNTQAQKLKDRLLVQNTKDSIVKNHISDADELKYRQAELYYNDRDKINASKIIDDLAERNPQVLKIAKLKTRIDNM